MSRKPADEFQLTIAAGAVKRISQEFSHIYALIWCAKLFQLELNLK